MVKARVKEVKKRGKEDAMVTARI